MKKPIFFLLALLCFAPGAYAQDEAEANGSEDASVASESSVTEASNADEAAAEESAGEESPAMVAGGPKTMSGMSILGNEETPKSLVIVPWKSSEMGDELSLSDTLDERARPVDKEVFLRELNFYQIRSNEH
jgi:hypothetical protein